MGYDNFVATLSPGEQLYIDSRKLLKGTPAVRDLDPDDHGGRRRSGSPREGAVAAQQDQDKERNDRLIEATIRETLAGAVKNLTQSDKNTAGAQAVPYNTILAGLEKGVTPEEIAHLKDGTSHGLPDGVMTKMELENQPKPEPKAAAGGKK
jgi:hypothetical protein